MICKSRSGTRKLLAVSAVLAMAFCVFAAAVPADAADGTEVPTYTMSSNENVISWNNGSTTEMKTLKEAMEILQNGDIISGTMTFPEGNFDVAWGNETTMGSAFYINASNVVITGDINKTVIFCSKITKGSNDGTFTFDNIKANAQNVITMNKSITLNSFTLMNNVYDSDGSLYWYKTICVNGGEPIIKNCILIQNDKIEGLNKISNNILGDSKGGLIVVWKGNATIEECKLYDGRVNTYQDLEECQVHIKNTEISIENEYNTPFGGFIPVNNFSTASDVKVKIASNDANASRIITYAVPGVSIEVDADAKLTSYTTLKEGVDLNINKGHSLSIPSGVELNISEGSDVNIDGTLNVYGKLTSSGTISGNGTVFADQDSVIPSDLADDITVTHPFVPMPDEDDEFPGYVPGQSSSDDSSNDNDSTTQVAIVAAAIAVVLIAIIALLYKSR